MLIFLDTETTGLYSSDDQIMQLSYIICDTKLNIIQAKNFYLDVDVDISPDAEKVHGLSKDKIEKLSGGKKFKDYAKEIMWDFHNARVICHNADFDTGFLEEEFKRIDKPILIKDTFCTMINYTQVLNIPHDFYIFKWPKLSEVVDYLNLDITELKTDATEVFKSDTGDFHDARLDVYTTYKIYKKLKEDAIEKNIEDLKIEIDKLDIKSDIYCFKNISVKIEGLIAVKESINKFETGTINDSYDYDDGIPF